MMKDILSEIVEKTRSLVNSREFCEKHRDSPKSFTRLRCTGFAGVTTLILNFLRKSLQVEIDKYMELTDPAIEKPMSKQAFSKARHKISANAFRELFEMTCQSVTEKKAFGTYTGYRVFVVDGSEIQLPENAGISGKFRQTRGSFSPHARAGILCDVITGFTVHANFDTTEVGERDLAMEHLRYFEPYRQAEDLIVFDRGYPSKALIKYLDSGGFKYLMRLQKSFNAEIDNPQKADFYVRIPEHKVRVIKLLLSSGETEILITNLGRKAFKTADFKDLYHLRRGVETKYSTLKNKLDIEDFSGKTLVTVQQDFYAALFLSNISAAAKTGSDDIIRTDNAEKDLKYGYKTNENILTGKLKDKFILILLNDNAEHRQLAAFRQTHCSSCPVQSCDSS